MSFFAVLLTLYYWLLLFMRRAAGIFFSIPFPFKSTRFASRQKNTSSNQRAKESNGKQVDKQSTAVAGVCECLCMRSLFFQFVLFAFFSAFSIISIVLRRRIPANVFFSHSIRSRGCFFRFCFGSDENRRRHKKQIAFVVFKTNNEHTKKSPSFFLQTHFTFLLFYVDGIVVALHSLHLFVFDT